MRDSVSTALFVISYAFSTGPGVKALLSDRLGHTDYYHTAWTFPYGPIITRWDVTRARIFIVYSNHGSGYTTTYNPN